MESPITSIKFIHKAIRTECGSLEQAVEMFDAEGDARAVDLARRFAFLSDMVKTHEDGEEDALFPAMDSRIYPISAPYLLDHRVDQLHMQEIGQSFERLATTADATGRADVMRALWRQAIAINSAMTLHIRKEEEILVPLVEKNFSVDEQKAIVSQAISHFTPEQMQVGLPWIIKALEPQEQEGYLRMMMEEMPPPVFRAATQWIAAGVSAAQWAEIVRRLPEAA